MITIVTVQITSPDAPHNNALFSFAGETDEGRVDMEWICERLRKVQDDEIKRQARKSMLECVKKRFEASRVERTYRSLSGVRLFPNERDKLWLDWFHYCEHEDRFPHDESIKTFLEIYPAKP